MAAALSSVLVVVHGCGRSEAFATSEAMVQLFRGVEEYERIHGRAPTAVADMVGGSKPIFDRLPTDYWRRDMTLRVNRGCLVMQSVGRSLESLEDDLCMRRCNGTVHPIEPCTTRSSQ
jgi:hypothetical protein